VWGIGEDGELRGMWRQTRQPGLWITGSSFTQSRTMSRPLALQIAAQELGLIPAHPSGSSVGPAVPAGGIRDQIETDTDVETIDM
jgi:hypothetical protein